MVKIESKIIVHVRRSSVSEQYSGLHINYSGLHINVVQYAVLTFYAIHVLALVYSGEKPITSHIQVRALSPVINMCKRQTHHTLSLTSTVLVVCLLLQYNPKSLKLKLRLSTSEYK